MPAREAASPTTARDGDSLPQAQGAYGPSDRKPRDGEYFEIPAEKVVSILSQPRGAAPLATSEGDDESGSFPGLSRKLDELEARLREWCLEAEESVVASAPQETLPPIYPTAGVEAPEASCPPDPLGGLGPRQMLSWGLPQTAVIALEKAISSVTGDGAATGEDAQSSWLGEKADGTGSEAATIKNGDCGQADEERAMARINEARFVDLVSQQVTSAYRELGSRLDAGLAQISTLAEKVVGLGSRMDAVVERQSADAIIDEFRREMARILERFDRADQGFASLKSLEQTIEALLEGLVASGSRAGEARIGADQGARVRAESNLAHEIGGLRSAQEETRRRLDAASAAILRTLETIANQLARLEADRSGTRSGRPLPAQTSRQSWGALARPSPHARAGAPPFRRREPGIEANAARTGQDARAMEPGAEEPPEVLIEPGQGFPGPDDAKPPRTSRTPARAGDCGPAATGCIGPASASDDPADPPAAPGSAGDERGAAATDPAAGSRRLFRLKRGYLIFAITLLIAMGALAWARVMLEPS